MGRKLHWSTTVGWLVLFALPLAVIVTASTLTPNPIGHSTHTQLGLPPCGFLLLTGVPCPGCGLTTAFAHMANFDPIGAASANPFGIPLFLVSAFTIPFSAWGYLRGLRVIETLERFHFEKVAIMLSISSILVWGTRLLAMAWAHFVV